jgi:NAD dependent epimerase/dehydratase family
MQSESVDWNLKAVQGRNIGRMRIIIFGATGMVGQGALRECLLDAGVERVLVVGRTPTGKQDAKLRELLLPDISQIGKLGGELAGYDACLFCLGVSSVGKSEAEYRKVTYDLTMAVAEALVKRNPGMVFVYVTGAGTDSTERGRMMWARVKGQTENALLRMPFRGAYMFRPGYIQPVHGVRPKTKFTVVLYAVFGWLYPVLKALFPGQLMTTECLGKAMIRVARNGAEKKVLGAPEIIRVCHGKSGGAE